MSLKQTHIAAFSPLSGQSHTQNSSLSSAVTLTKPANADALLISVLTQAVRFTLDGTTPTAAKGFRIPTGQGPMIIDAGSGCTAIKIIEESASAAIEYQWGHF